MVKMVEKQYFIYNQDEIRNIGSGVRKIFVKESKKYAYIRDNFGNKARMKLNFWLQLKEHTFDSM